MKPLILAAVLVSGCTTTNTSVDGMQCLGIYVKLKVDRTAEYERPKGERDDEQQCVSVESK